MDILLVAVSHTTGALIVNPVALVVPALLIVILVIIHIIIQGEHAFIVIYSPVIDAMVLIHVGNAILHITYLHLIHVLHAQLLFHFAIIALVVLIVIGVSIRATPWIRLTTVSHAHQSCRIVFSAIL